MTIFLDTICSSLMISLPSRFLEAMLWEWPFLVKDFMKLAVMYIFPAFFFRGIGRSRENVKERLEGI